MRGVGSSFGRAVGRSFDRVMVGIADMLVDAFLVESFDMVLFLNIGRSIDATNGGSFSRVVFFTVGGSTDSCANVIAFVSGSRVAVRFATGILFRKAIFAFGLFYLRVRLALTFAACFYAMAALRTRILARLAAAV